MGLLSWLTDKNCAECGQTFNAVKGKDSTLCDMCFDKKKYAEEEKERKRREQEAQNRSNYINQLKSLGLVGIAQRFARGEKIVNAGIAIWDDLSLTNKLDRLASGIAISIASGGFLSNPRKMHPLGIVAVTDKTLLCIQLGHYEEDPAKIKPALDNPESYNTVYVAMNTIEIKRREDEGVVILETAGDFSMKIILPDEFKPEAGPLFEILDNYDYKAVAESILSAHQNAKK